MPQTATPWQALYTPTPVSAWIAEAPASWHRTIPEKLVRCLWFDQRWRPSLLRTLDGREILVHSPGRWNLQAGPDFHHASIEFVGGDRHRGDVEIHCAASGWTAHRHHLDVRYNSVILHVFLWNDRPAAMAQRADGQWLPQVALAPYLSRPLAAYQADIILEDYPYKTGHAHGRCYETLQRLTAPEVSDILARAGDTRLQQRVWRWSRRATEIDLAQAMYEAILRALGSTGHRQHFQALARLASWHDLQRCLHDIPAQDCRIAAEALLLGLAGIVPPTIPTGAAVDAETGEYIRALQEYWDLFPADLRQRAWHNVDWSQLHVRPANTPQRRLAGMAQMLAHYRGTSLLDAAVALCRTHCSWTDTQTARALCHALARLLDVPMLSYWTRRAHLGGRIGKGQRLIGVQRAHTVVIDAMLPILLVYAQRHADAALSDRLLACYHAAPLLPDNHVLRYMRHRMLGNHPALLVHVTGARQQQGLLQLFTDFCGNDEGNCQGCAFPLL